MNFLKKVHNSAKLKRIKAKRNKLEKQLKAVGREYKAAFKTEARKMRTKKK